MYSEPIRFIKNGKVRSITPNVTSSNEEVIYSIQHGEKEMMMTYGMGYPLKEGYSPDIGKSNTISQVIHDPRYRDALISYIGRYVTVPQQAIYRAIPTGATDRDVAKNLSKLPKVRSSDDRVRGRVHMMANTMSKVAHVKVDHYLDYGTGRGDVALAIGKMLDATTTGVEVYDDPNRVVDTKIISQGELLPTEWEGRFQLITAFSVLHHVERQEETIRELCRVLAPGGLLLIREHDYKDEAIIWDNGPKILEPKDRPFRVFLDAIHVAAMAVSSTSGIEPDSWALYRGKNEWDAMVMTNEGMVVASTSYTSNPQRIYNQVYMKYPTSSVPLILEQRMKRSDMIHGFFPRPRMGATLGPMPKLVEGINYDEEILAYMTPWRLAQETSKIIAKRMKDKYNKVSRYRLMDGTGGAGGNVMAFAQNRSISFLTAYERVPSFFRYMVNNVGLYMPDAPRQGRERTTYRHGDQLISLYNEEFSIGKVDLRGTVLFLDIPWEHEGTGYKLEGYSYSGMSLEDVTKMALEKGAYMVVLKLPPGYRLGIRSDRVDLGKEDLLFIYPWFMKKKEEVVKVPGGDLVMEVMRFKLMSHIRDEFRRIFPDMKDNYYYRWLFERLGLGTLDPIIPATKEYVPSEFLIMSQVEVPMRYGPLYKLATSLGIPRKEIPKRHDVDGITALRQRIQATSSTGDDSKVRELDEITRDMYDLFRSVKRPGKVEVTQKKVGQYINLTVKPDKRLIDTLASFPGPSIRNIELTIISDKEMELRKRHRGYKFMDDMASMLMRYSMTMEEVAGVNMHAAIPEQVFNLLKDGPLKVRYEGFASPLNATLDQYYSAFPDVDRVFGSLGSFFNSDSITGSWELNPPFVSDVMDSMAKKIQHMMDEADKVGESLSMVIIVPSWTSSTAIDMMTESKHTRKIIKLTGDQHRYVTGSHHLGAKTISFNITTSIFFIQSDVGVVKYPIPDDIETSMTLAFK